MGAEAQKLVRMIQEHIDEYYSSYEPVKYIESTSSSTPYGLGRPVLTAKPFPS